MKKNLSHLPVKKREELKRVVDHIRLHCSKTQMVILYGSYARDDWISSDEFQEGHILYEYSSDYDIFVVVPTKDLAEDGVRWSGAATAINDDKKIEPWVQLIVEAVDHVNEQLKKARSYYRDLYRDGVILYDTGKHKLANPEKLTSEERHRVAEEDFEVQYTEKATSHLESYQFNLKRGNLNQAAYDLNQATESCFAAVHLVFTGYKPRTHDIEKLEPVVIRADSRFRNVFPRRTWHESQRFHLLRRAYQDARFDRNYKITKGDLDVLARQVRKLMSLTHMVCRKKIDSLL